MNGLACTICGRPSFAKLRVEIDQGSATYLVCPDLDCMGEAMSRAGVNLANAANARLAGVPYPDAIDTDVRMLTPDEIREIERGP